MEKIIGFCFEGEKAPLYNAEKGYGFVSESCAIKPRKVDVGQVKVNKTSCSVMAEDESLFMPFLDESGKVNLDKVAVDNLFNFGGMIFRVNVPAGCYHIEVVTTTTKEKALVSVSGMRGTMLLRTGYWDAGHFVPVRHYATWEGNTWSFDYVNTRPYIDIELEPLVAYEEVGIEQITITTLPEAVAGEKKNLMILGDSTAKSYIFTEAPMSGWGQMVDRLFDAEAIDVVNYSNGGRSLKVMYFENRWNDLLLTGKPGDYILLQSGHNDERDTPDGGEDARFGRGATEEMFERYLEEIFIPAAKLRGMHLILMTPTVRLNWGADGRCHNSFTNRRFPDITKRVAAKYQLPLIDLTSRGVDYINSLGKEGAEAIVLSIEAGETPGKTNSGSYANGHPNNHLDGTHMKEVFAKHYARLAITDLYGLSLTRPKLAPLATTIKEEVKEAIALGNWEKIYPEMCRDVLTGKGAYYRNQIEKLVQVGVFKKDDKGYFYPEDLMSVGDFAACLIKLYHLEPKSLQAYQGNESILRREVMATMLLTAYDLNFKETPKYITDFNGTTITPNHPDYDPNLVGEEAMYYPLVDYTKLEDLDDISPSYKDKVERAYRLGLIRSEEGIQRGKMMNGTRLMPKEQVTRAKAAKALYFMWVLNQDITVESHYIN